MGSKATEIDHPILQNQWQILITDCPRGQENYVKDEYLPMLLGHNVKSLIRLCDPDTYDSSPLTQNGIDVNDTMAFDDGTPPTPEVLSAFRDFVDDFVATHVTPQLSSDTTSSFSKPSLAIHCVSGIGRAPVLAVVALVDAGVDPLDAVEYIRKRRRGALNKKQLEWVVDSKKGLTTKKAGSSNKKSVSKGIFSFSRRESSAKSNSSLSTSNNINSSARNSVTSNPASATNSTNTAVSQASLANNNYQSPPVSNPSAPTTTTTTAATEASSSTRVSSSPFSFFRKKQ